MAESFRIYVDESGDEGFAFGSGSSEWFVISAVVFKTVTELETVKLVDNVRSLLRKPPRKPLHFRNLKHQQKVAYIKAIAASDLRVISVLVHKPSLYEPEVFRARYRLYFYAVRYLLERVSWYCRDHRSPKLAGDGSALVTFSNRSSMSYDELCDYLRRLERQDDVSIEWSVIKPAQVCAVPHANRRGLQIADAVASGFYKAVERDNYGNTEPRYACDLKQVVYHYSGRYVSYGIKLFPKELVKTVADDLKWIGTCGYKK